MDEESTSKRVYESLLRDIQDGSLAAGFVLGEAEQARNFAVSRTPVREAIKRLVAEGLATRLSPRVTVVSGFDTDDIRKLFEARRAVEEFAVRLASLKTNRNQFARLATDFELAARELPLAVDSYYALIENFDRSIDDAVENTYLVAAMRVVRTHLVRARNIARSDEARLRASALEHKLIAQAISVGDGQLASHAMHVHLHNASNAILESLEKGV